MARRRGKVSMTRQIERTIQGIQKFGESKKIAKKDGSSKEGVYVNTTMKRTIESANQFARYAKENFGVRSIYHLKEEHYKAFISHQLESCKPSTVRTIETDLRKFQTAMRKESEKHSREPVRFCTEKRVVSGKDIAPPRDRSYTPRESRILKGNVSPRVKVALELSENLGLRVREACGVREHMFKSDQKGNMQLVITKSEAKGLTKGGRPRTVPVPKQFEPRLREMLYQAQNNKGNRLVSVKTNSVHRAIQRACNRTGLEKKEAVHGYRHSYARSRFEALCKERGIEVREAKSMLETCMLNRDNKFRVDYNISDRSLYGAVSDIKGQVMQELGHGKDRWDLVAVYLR